MTIEETPRPSALRRWARIFGVLLLHFVAVLLVLVVLCRIVPGYAVFYGRADIVIPPATVQVIRLSEFCTAFFAPILLLGMVADAAIVTLFAYRTPARQWLLGAYFQMWLLGMMILLVHTSIAVAVPVLNEMIKPVAGAAVPGM